MYYFINTEITYFLTSYIITENVMVPREKIPQMCPKTVSTHCQCCNFWRASSFFIEYTEDNSAQQELEEGAHTISCDLDTKGMF